MSANPLLASYIFDMWEESWALRIFRWITGALLVAFVIWLGWQFIHGRERETDADRLEAICDYVNDLGEREIAGTYVASDPDAFPDELRPIRKEACGY